MFAVLVTAFSINTVGPAYEEFSRLAPREQKKSLHTALETRRTNGRNLQGKIRVESYVAPIQNGVIGLPEATPDIAEQEYRQRDDSFWLRYKSWMSGEESPLFDVTTSYNASTGAWRNLTMHAQVAGKHGTIDSGKRAATQNNYLAMLLGREYARSCESMLDFLIKHYDSVAIESLDDAAHEVVVSVESKKSATFHDVRKYRVSPDRGYLIMSMNREIRSFGPKGTFTVSQRFTVLSTDSASGYCFPESARLVATENSEKGTVYEFRISDFQVGGVTEDDLTVTFPKGTQVNDRIMKKFYIAGNEEDFFDYSSSPDMVLPPKSFKSPRQ